MKKTLVFLFVLINCFTLQAQKHLFDFGSVTVKKGYTAVLPGTVYNDQKGYGFDFGSKPQGHSYKGKDLLKSDYISGNQPFYFSVKVPEGNYNVKVILGDPIGTSRTTIKAEGRRLMVEEAATEKGKFREVVFTVHVRDSFISSGPARVRLKPRERDRLIWDNKLTLEFNNKEPKVCGVEITPVRNIPTVFLAGNSTVVDQSEEPWASWGQMIPQFFKGGKVAVANYAESGETLKAFKGERRLEKIWSLAKPGDYLFIEFAHNDQKAGGNFLDPFTTYTQTLKEWIGEAKKRGVITVLVTSTHRRSFDSTGKISNTLGDYPEAMRRVGVEEGVALIDLNAMSAKLYEALGAEGSIKAFVHYPANSFPNQPAEIKDNTHFSTYGAYELAKCVVTGIREKVPGLAKHLKEGMPLYDPSVPGKFEAWYWPPSSFISSVKPDGN
jgi:lysophospholipase L1-like esterase